MEILLRTKKSYWELSFRNGIRRATTLDWDNASATMESLVGFQADEARKALKAPGFQTIDEAVSAGAAEAPKANKRWRAAHNARWRQESEGADTTLIPDDEIV